VFRICAPVFAIMGIGRMLYTRGILTDTNKDFCVHITYYFALPALIFSALVQQSFSDLLNPALIVSTIVAIGIITVLFIILAVLLRIDRSIAPPFIFSSFWANVSYIGFPLAANSFGDERGIALAAIINGFTVPVFVSLSLTLITFYRGDRHPRGVWKHCADVARNPVVLSSLLGLLVSFIAGAVPWQLTDTAWSESMKYLWQTVISFLKLLGSMGLPLALLAVGASLDLKRITGKRLPLYIAITGKLFIMPCITLVAIDLFFPDTMRAGRAIAVMLMATPNAVASYVVAKQFGVAEEFMSAMVVLSTAVSVLSIPLWVYFLL
jgi:hypothetical protein